MQQKWILMLALTAMPLFAQEDIMPRPPKRAVTASALSRLIHDTRIGEPQGYRNLVVYPLFTSGRGERGYVTLDHALAKGMIRITEKGEGNVPELLVENRSDEPIFLLAGEIVKGGKQNRVVSQDILLAPHSGPLSLGVFCVEHGRWARQTSHFAAESDMAHSNLRQQLNAPRVAQSGVWAEVARKSSAVASAMPNETGYLGKMYEDKEVRRDLDDYAGRIRLPADANGMAVVIDGRVVGVEIFGNSETFGKLRDKLLRSYAVDAGECRSEEKVRDLRDEVARFLRRAGDVRLAPKESIGLGQFFKIESGGLYGSVLLWQEQRGAHDVVHAGLFDESPVIRAK